MDRIIVAVHTVRVIVDESLGTVEFASCLPVDDEDVGAPAIRFCSRGAGLLGLSKEPPALPTTPPIALSHPDLGRVATGASSLSSFGSRLRFNPVLRLEGGPLW